MPKRLAKGATIPTEFPSVPQFPTFVPSSNSSQLPIPILTNAYSLSDSLQFPPPTTLHSSHFRCCCYCCLLSPLLPAAPSFLSSFSRFFLLLFPLSRGSVVWLATQPHQHGHTRGHTTRWQQRHLPTCFSSLPGEGTQAQEVPSEQSKAHAVRHVVEGHSNAADLPHSTALSPSLSLLKNNAHG